MGFKDAGKPHYLGHRERLRRRFREAGADALPDYELLEMILFRAVPRRDTIAHRAGLGHRARDALRDHPAP